MIYCATLDFAEDFSHQTSPLPWAFQRGRSRRDDDGMLLLHRDLHKVFPSSTWWLIDKSSDDTWSSIMARAKWWKLMSGILKSRNAQNFSLLFHSFARLGSASDRREKWIIWRGEINNEMALLPSVGVFINNARNWCTEWISLTQHERQMNGHRYVAHFINGEGFDQPMRHSGKLSW